MITLGIVALIIVGALLFLVSSLAGMYRKAGPNQALIVYGLGGTKVVIGSGAFVFPMFRRCQDLSLELRSFDVAPQNKLYTNQGVAVTIEAVTQLKIKSDFENVRTAAEQFLNKQQEEVDAAIRLVMEGHLRGIVGQLTVESIVKEPEMVGDKVRSTCTADLAKMGLEMISFTIKNVSDENEYIKNMGLPDIARIKMQANIAAAEAQRDTEIKAAQALREAAVAKAQADQERVIAETASKAKQAEAQRDLEVKEAEFNEAVQRQKAQADKAYEIQANVMQQQVVAEQVKIQQVERVEQVKLQETEILRREKELIATDLKAAEIEGKRRIALAEAERSKTQIEAEGRAVAIRREGEAAADVLKLKGEAEAAVIRAKGEAEAAAMDVRAKAYLEYNEAAVVDKFLTGLPEVVRAFAEPLTRVDKITVVSTGENGGGTGMSRVTGDVARMMAQVPDVIEALSGVSMGDLLRGLPKLKGREAKMPVTPAAEVTIGRPVNGTDEA